MNVIEVTNVHVQQALDASFVGSFGKIRNEKDLEELYPRTVTFYPEPPEDSVSLQQFEQCAIDRLKLLRIFERISLTAVDKYTPDWVSIITAEIRKSGLVFHCLWGTNGAQKQDILLARKYDHVSHYILRLAYCRTEELRKWFITYETDYFRYKFLQTCTPELRDFLSKESGWDYKTLSSDEKKEMEQELKDTFFYVSTKITELDIYKIPFTSCLELVKNRRVYLRYGMAYVVNQDLITIIIAKYRANLSKHLTEMSSIIPMVIEEDERLHNVLSDFDKRHTGKTYVAKKGKDSAMTVQILEQVYETSFPLCMKSLYEHVKTEHHLKHFGRLQLGLFFKGLGLPLDEAIKFWRTHFTKKAGVDGSRFDKQYLYNIRHMYGQEGRRADYTPYSCMKIIMSGVGPGENHGCPFRHSDELPLRAKLAQANIPSAGVKEIMELVEKRHYQIACQKYFEWTHAKATVEGGVNHPNQFFEESQNFLSGGMKVKTEAVEVKRTVSKVYPKSSVLDKETLMDVFNDEEDEILSQLELDSLETTLENKDESTPMES